MNYLILIPLSISLILSPPDSRADPTFWQDLYKKNGLYFERSVDKPFNGYVTGSQEGMLINGKKDGLWSGFYENGNLLWKGEYKEGKIISWKEFHSNGEIFVTGDYKNGEKSGVWRIFDKKGKLIAKELFENGKIIDTTIIK